MNKAYSALFRFGTNCGCHQLPERSFFIKGYQFPVCARCTGVLIEYSACLICHFLFGTKLTVCLAGCLVMFADWYIQYLGIKESTNIRRLITGIMGGYGVMGIQLLFVCFIIRIILDFIRNIG